MFNKERIENLEKRVKELERKEDVSRLSEDRSKRLIHALVDSNNEVVKRIFDDVYVASVYGTSVFQPPKAGDIHASNAVFSGEVFKQAVFNGIPDSLKKVEEDKTERAVERLKKENKQLKSVNAKMVESTLDSICREEDAVVGYLELKKRCEYLERDKKTLLASVGELQKQVFDISRDKKYLEMANTSLLQETRKIRESLNERIKKLRQRLKKSSIRYRDLKESISHNGLKSV